MFLEMFLYAYRNKRPKFTPRPLDQNVFLFFLHKLMIGFQKYTQHVMFLAKKSHFSTGRLTGERANFIFNHHINL